MRKFIFILVIFLGAAFIYLSFGKLESVVKTLQHGNLWFILLGVVFQLGWFVVTGYTYLSLYRVLGLDGTLSKLSLMAAVANFVSTIAPSAGMGGIVVFISEAKRNGGSAGKVTVASVLFLFLDYAAFMVVLTLALIVLLSNKGGNQRPFDPLHWRTFEGYQLRKVRSGGCAVPNISQ